MPRKYNSTINRRLLTVDGISKSVTEWARDKGIDRNRIFHRLQSGWPDDLAVNTPVLRLSERLPEMQKLRHSQKHAKFCRQCGVEFKKYRAAFCSVACRNLHNSARNMTHGGSNTRLFGIWAGMRDRCGNPNARGYANYGGRGITVCDEWRGKECFAAFRDWAMANGYSGSLTIDRIDNDKGYSPENCRWATQAQQNANKRKTYKPRQRAAMKTQQDRERT